MKKDYYVKHRLIFSLLVLVLGHSLSLNVQESCCIYNERVGRLAPVSNTPEILLANLKLTL
ncbi:hypothetical protein FNH22_14415 [Fulvivirga sp. M361]|uniref:hypothetical protein n=1 Tax=Fulvivirga sp. M361 TaxID=2594266 RepID=UPI001179D7AD|nr:hypothetical protein [Fulvivirga sp. M361]TRX58249.1 hypothetical protein FNH22_14415 [Fulvivirga sp. M361]